MRCEVCDENGMVPALVETDNGPVPCPYLGEPCPACGGTKIRHCCDGDTPTPRDDLEKQAKVNR